jgi:hypothetical protein
MTTPRVEATHPPTQAQILGEFSPAANVRLILRQQDAEMFLERPSIGSRAGTDEDIAAFVTREGDTMNLEGNAWHQRHQPVWMPSVEDWVRATIEAAS